jgi:GST-like protein
LLGEKYTIADMAAWGWVRVVPFVLGDTAWSTLPHLKRWLDTISARPAAVRANALKDRFTFKAEMDEEACRIMFPHTVKA